jgi:hypothetical protein
MLLRRSQNTEAGEAMRATSWAVAGLAAVALAWGGAGYLATKPVDFHDYRMAVVGAAQSAYDALATASLTGSALLAGRVTRPYTDSMLDDARSALAGAAKQFTDVAAPDDRTEAMRDQLGPLLTRANAVLPGSSTDLTRAALDAIQPVQAGLDQFITDHK